MTRLLLGLSWVGLLTPAACGGRVIEQRDAGGSDSGAPVATIPVGSAGTGGKTGASNPFPSHELGVCTPGFDHAQNSTRPCHWLTESGKCFDDINGACACICPRDRDSVCSSGFDDGPNSATLVHCD